MPRWSPDAVGRLQQAALDLFAERGFDQTTVAAIAERAGLTERTFFNHFAAKRDVLFGPITQRQREIVVRVIAGCADDVPPLDMVVRGLQSAADELLEDLRGPTRRRRGIIDATPELREREDGKRAALTAAVAAALEAHDVEPDVAILTARAGVLVQQTAEQRWTRPGESRPLSTLLADALQSLRTVVD